jgi:hypothetical protein
LTTVLHRARLSPESIFLEKSQKTGVQTPVFCRIYTFFYPFDPSNASTAILNLLYGQTQSKDQRLFFADKSMNLWLKMRMRPSEYLEKQAQILRLPAVAQQDWLELEGGLIPSGWRSDFFDHFLSNHNVIVSR